MIQKRIGDVGIRSRLDSLRGLCSVEFICEDVGSEIRDGRIPLEIIAGGEFRNRDIEGDCLEFSCADHDAHVGMRTPPIAPPRR